MDGCATLKDQQKVLEFALAELIINNYPPAIERRDIIVVKMLLTTISRYEPCKHLSLALIHQTTHMLLIF